MARGSEGKASRKQARKEARAAEAERILNGEDVNEFAGSPPTDDDAIDTSNGNADDDSSDSSDEEEEEEEAKDETLLPKTEKKTKSKSARAKKKAAAASAARSRGGGCEDGPCCSAPGGSPGEGIKTLPLIMLIMLTGTTVLPALLYLGDYASVYMQNNHMFGSLGHKLGIGPSPKKRVVSFYEKHEPIKVTEVDAILAKYYGDYPKLVKRLERKYGDYGYFINWELDESARTLAFEKLWETHESMSKQFDLYAPAVIKTGARNVRGNLGFLYKKGKKTWKKQIWPFLEPHLGVPDEKAARKQKLKDKKEAERRKRKATGQRRKSAEFRDDEDEM